MIIKYVFGGNDVEPGDDFIYEPDSYEVRTEVKRILSDMDKKSLIELLLDQDQIEDYFDWELEEYFKDDAYEQYKESKRRD